MQMKNLDLKEIKIAIFDFDDTLAIHKNKDYAHIREIDEKGLDYYLKAYQNPDAFYDEIEPCFRSEALYNFINKLRENNIKIYCLSGMRFSFHLKAKQSFVNKYYGSDIEVLSTGTQELKLSGVKILQKHNNCMLDEILFVDDREDVIELMRNNGVKAFLVSDFE